MCERDRPAAGEGRSEVDALQRFDRASDKFRKAVKRWNNRLPFEELSLSELYLNDRLTIICYFCPTSEPDHRESSGAMGHKRAVFHASAAVTFCANTGNSCYSQDRDEQPVFVYVVNLIEPPESVPCPSFVRLDRVQYHAGYIGTTSLYRSVRSGLFQSFPRFLEREVDVGVVSSFSSCHVTGDMIKRGAQIVDCVADTKCVGGADWFCNLDAYAVSSGVRIELSKNSITVSIINQSITLLSG
jgi:hypothetical protein